VIDHQGSRPQGEPGKNGAHFVAAISFWHIKIWSSCTGTFLDNYREAVTAVATIFIAIFTWTLWWATRRLGEFARKQADDTKQALKTAATAAEAALISADANEVLANVAKLSLENERAALEIAKTAGAASYSQAQTARDAIRPWVFTHPWPAESKRIGEEIHFPMYLRCYGGGPATVVSIGVHCADAAPTKDTPLEIVTDIREINIGLAPDNNALYPERDLDLYRTTTDRPYVFGFIRYKDRFSTYTSRFTVKLGAKGTDGVAMLTAGDPAWSRFDEATAKS